VNPGGEGVEHKAGLGAESRLPRRLQHRLLALRPRGLAPLWRLMGYVAVHRKDAALTLGFGTLGFLLSFVYPWIIGSVVDLVGSQTPPPSWQGRLLELTELAALTGLLHAVVLYGRGHFNLRLGASVARDLRQQLFEHLQRLSGTFYARQRTGALLSRVLHDVNDAISVVYLGIIVAVLDAGQLLLAFSLLWGIDPKLTLACVVVLPMYGLVFAVMNRRVREASERERAQRDWIAGQLSERLSGHALIKTYTAEQREAAQFTSALERLRGLSVAQSHQGHLVVSLGEVLVHLGTTVVIGYGGYLAIHAELTAGMLTRFLGYVVILYGPVRRFAELNTVYQSSLSAMRRIFELLDIRPAVTEKPRPRRSPPLAGHVRFEAVGFSYHGSSDESRACGEMCEVTPAPDQHPARTGDVLQDVSLEALPGERIAIVGPSGAGKTTLLSLLPRLQDVNHGRIVVDGTDVRAYALSTLRSAIAIVQQDSVVFSGTVFENIAYGRPEASTAQLLGAARAAHAHEFIERWPLGYETRLGERGIDLSGGQRQRLSIARALLKDPRILVLDEATSALDTESEQIVQHALERLMRNRTCFIIAHRLSTIANVDRIVVLDRGRVVESGSHGELVARRGRYASLIHAQATLIAG
jgi:ABC-type multidrug transport system fused ATPase/permease subunit